MINMSLTYVGILALKGSDIETSEHYWVELDLPECLAEEALEESKGYLFSQWAPVTMPVDEVSLKEGFSAKRIFMHLPIKDGVVYPTLKKALKPEIKTHIFDLKSKLSVINGIREAMKDVSSQGVPTLVEMYPFIFSQVQDSIFYTGNFFDGVRVQVLDDVILKSMPGATCIRITTEKRGSNV